MTFSTNSEWGGAFSNAIIKHHKTGSHGEHIVPMFIYQSTPATNASYDANSESGYLHSDLSELGDGEIPYTISVKIAGGGSMSYDYLVNLDDTTPEEYREAVELYRIPKGDRPSPGFYPDIYEAIALIVADQLGVERDELKPENLPPYNKDIVAEAVMEVYEDDEE